MLMMVVGGGAVGRLCWMLVGAVAAVETKTSLVRSVLSVGAAVLREW